MPYSVNFYKGISLHVIPVRNIVSWIDDVDFPFIALI